jgi:hypothetical protein
MVPIFSLLRTNRSVLRQVMAIERHRTAEVTDIFRFKTNTLLPAVESVTRPTGGVQWSGKSRQVSQLLARPERCPTGDQTREEWFSYKITYNLQSKPEQNINRKSNVSIPACFLADNGRCMFPRFRHKTSTSRRQPNG